MAQSKSSPSGPSGKSGRPGGGGSRPGGKPGAARSGAGKPGAKTTASSAADKTAAGKAAAGKAAGSRVPGTPPRKKKPKSIVNQKQTPWGLIVTTVVVVLFAVGVVGIVIATKKDGGGDSGATSTTTGGQKVDASSRYRQPELPAAAAIKGVTYRVEGQSTHVQGRVKYDRTPPIGGNHSQYWADCTGTVYDKAIANENAVHMLEHGAVWIAYNADEIKGAALKKLESYVSGVDRMAMSPYPNLSTPISLQAWGYQLKVTSADDPRIAEFIKVLKFNQKTTPEPNATCSQPTFKESPTTFNNPKDTP